MGLITKLRRYERFLDDDRSFMLDIYIFRKIDIISELMGKKNVTLETNGITERRRKRG